MKKLLAMSMAVMMMAGIAPISAAEKGATVDVDSTDKTSDQNGEIWGTLAKEALSQLKVTMPIRIDFAVAPAKVVTEGVTPDPKNEVIVGDYKMSVAADSEVGVELTKITIKNAKDGLWTLASAADLAKTADVASGGTPKTDAQQKIDEKTVVLQIAEKELVYGENKLAADAFVIKKGYDRSLGVKGTATLATIQNSDAKAELAFDVVYTIAQKKEAESPAA